MNILGITCYVHDSAACIVKDGILVANIEEERLNRIKHTNVFPRKSIKYVLKTAGLNLADIDIIAFNWNPLKALVWEFLKLIMITPFVYYKMLKYNKPPKHLKTILASFLLKHTLKKEFGKGFQGKVVWVDHHMAHASSVYYLSTFSQADILVIDGFGEFSATTYLQAQGSKIKSRWWLPVYDSLGIVYLNITRFLGFGPFEEGKTMALAALGNDSYKNLFEKIIKNSPNGRYSIDKNYLAWWRLINGTFKTEIGLPRKYGDAIEQRHMDIAASLQKKVTDTVLHIIKKTSKTTNNKHLCMAGGLFLNCSINSVIQNSGYYEKYFISPIPSDAGGAIGAALYAAFAIGNEKYRPLTAPFSPFLGPEYTNNEIENTLKNSGLKYKKVKNPGVAAAHAIAECKTVGWMQGRIESGPRALGARSILANPLDKNIQAKLNSKIKDREYFQPFAPVVTEKAALKYFKIEYPFQMNSYYMLHTVQVKKTYRKKLPGITHVDGSARIQVVRQEWNPELYNLLKEFENITGFGIVINTSFNRHEPIVCSPYDAVNTFKKTGLDILAVGNFIVEKEADN